MKIEITEKSKIRSAIKLANNHRFYDALCIFTQVDCYESMLNQIACLCEMEEIHFAIDLYRYTKQKYGEEYAVFTDLNNMDGVAEQVFAFCDPNQAHAESTQGQKHADKSLLWNFELPDREEFLTPDLNYVADDAYYYDPKYSPDNFYDVKSELYFDSLRINMERCYLEGDETQAKKFGKRLMALETDHLPTLEAQISLVLYSEKYKNGVRYAKRLAEVEGGSQSAIGGAIEILMQTDPQKNLPVLKKLMDKALNVLSEIALFDLEDYVYIASDFLHDYQMAYTFADMLFKDFRRANLEALKVCACAFYNVGDLENAKHAAISLLRAVPKCTFAKVMFDYLKDVNPDDIIVPFEFVPRYFRHNFVPTKLAEFAQRKLINLLESQEEPCLGEEELQCISLLIDSCASLVILNMRKDYYAMATFIRAAVRTFPVKDKAVFFDFAKKHLYSIMCDQSIGEYLLAQMLVLGYTDKVLIGLHEGDYYALDCAKISGAPSSFYFSFAICAVFFAVNKPEKYLDLYNDIAQTVTIDESDQLMSHKLAYTMLRKCQKGFAKSEEEQFFTEEEKTLYKQYKDAKKQ